MQTLTIQRNSDIPDSTYFRATDCEPELSADGLTLTIYDGEGRRRSSWGAPGVTSSVILETDSLVVVHVGFHHKHRGGQFWRYYRPTESGAWQRVEWAQLDDMTRQQVLDSYQQHAPAWAKAPGKLRANYKAPEMQTRTTYKLVEVYADGSLHSVYDEAIEYVIGKRLAERAVDDHGGGYYSYLSASGVKRELANGGLWPSHIDLRGRRLALIECEISGKVIEYGYWDHDAGEYGEYIVQKLASTYLRPMRVIETIDYQPAQEGALA